jgi:SAM-dependent methyltransferase
MPIEDGRFDRVLAVECAFHFSSRAGFFAEAARVLAPSGILVMSDFVASARARELAGDPGFPRRALRARLEEGLGPWPDLFGEEGDPADLAARAELVLRERRDASRNVAPSFRCLLPDHDRAQALSAVTRTPERSEGSVAHVVTRALLTLARLHAQGLVRLEYHAYERS